MEHSHFDSTNLHIGTEPQLFVDNWNIESVHGITRRWYKPERYTNDPILKKDKPWEMFPYFTYSNYCVLFDPKDNSKPSKKVPCDQASTLAASYFDSNNANTDDVKNNTESSNIWIWVGTAIGLLLILIIFLMAI